MTPLKWSIIVILGGITLLGLPIEADSEAPTEENKPSSTEECRSYILKALEQCSDQKGSPQTQNACGDQGINKQQDPNLNEEKETASESEINPETEETISDDDDEDDDDDDEEQSDDEETLNENESNVIEDNETDNEEDDEEMKDDDDNNDDDESDDDKNEINDTDDEEEQENVHDQSSEDNSEEQEDDDDDNETDSTENNRNEETVDEDDDEENDDEEDDEEENDSEQEAEVETTADEKSTSNKDELNQDENGNEEDDDEDEDDDDEEEENEETEDDGVTSNTDVEENIQSETSSNEIKIEIQVETDKVTGEADNTSARVATEFLDEKPSLNQPEASQIEEKNLNVTVEEDSDDDEDDDDSGSEVTDETDDLDDDSIENIYEDDDDDDDDSTSGVTYRSRDHIDVILGLDEIGTEYDKEDEKLAQNIFKEIKKIHLTQIKPMEMLYKYTDSTTRVLGDAEIFNKPMIVFLGPWSAGKSSIINYLLGTERTPAALKTGTGITDVDFTLLTYGEQNRVTSGTELAADWRYAGLQKFGQGFLDHFRSIQLPHTLLKQITIVDTPGILENKKNAERGYSLNDAFQWFIDRSDAVYVVLDPTKVDIGSELGSVIDQLKGRDARFILNKADSIRRSDLMRVVGQLFWNLSPLMSSSEAPVIYAVSLTTKPYHPSAPAKFLSDQEKNFLYDMKSTLDKRVENRILYARRHAVRVRNHCKMVDCYLATYYRTKSIFSNKRNVAKQITENPREYNIFDGLGGMTNVSRYDLPDPIAYKEFFKLHPLYDFKPLASTCSYFRGCPMDKLDLAISKDIPELLAKYKKMKLSDSPKQER